MNDALYTGLVFQSLLDARSVFVVVGQHHRRVLLASLFVDLSQLFGVLFFSGFVFGIFLRLD